MELKSKDTERVVKPNKTKRKTSFITKNTYISAIEASTGTLTDVSRRLNVTVGGVSLYLDKHPDLRLLLSDKRMSNVQLAEDVLFEHLSKSTAPNIRQDSAKYITGRLGKKMGWVEKTEFDVSNSNNLSKEQMDEIIERLKK